MITSINYDFADTEWEALKKTWTLTCTSARQWEVVINHLRPWIEDKEAEQSGFGAASGRKEAGNTAQWQ